MYRDKISILGKEIRRGQSEVVEFDFAKLHTRNHIQVPVIVERAKKDGPVLLLISGLHGDEINGIEIVRRIIRSGKNKPQMGTVICIPVFNIFGFINLSRYFPDGRDLNRVFPGSSKGSLASQFAYQFMNEVAPVVDYVLDFHSGGADRTNMAQTRCHFNDKKAVELAKIFNAPFTVHSKYIAKSFRASLNRKGKTAVLFEGGKSLSFDEEAIQYGINGTLNVLHYLGMIENPGSTETQTVIVRKSKWIRAPYAGMFHAKVKNGTMVTKKSLIGLITDPYGEFEKKVLAPSDGHIFCINTSGVVNRGDALFHFSIETGE